MTSRIQCVPTRQSVRKTEHAIAVLRRILHFRGNSVIPYLLFVKHAKRWIKNFQGIIVIFLKH